MADDDIYMDPGATTSKYIRVDGQCYELVGNSPHVVTKHEEDIQGEFSDCKGCDGSSSSSSSSSSSLSSSSSSSGGPPTCYNCNNGGATLFTVTSNSILSWNKPTLTTTGPYASGVAAFNALSDFLYYDNDPLAAPQSWTTSSDPYDIDVSGNYKKVFIYGEICGGEFSTIVGYEEGFNAAGDSLGGVTLFETGPDMDPAVQTTTETIWPGWYTYFLEPHNDPFGTWHDELIIATLTNNNPDDCE